MRIKIFLTFRTSRSGSSLGFSFFFCFLSSKADDLIRPVIIVIVACQKDHLVGLADLSQESPSPLPPGRIKMDKRIIKNKRERIAAGDHIDQGQPRGQVKLVPSPG
jgi:hypothetical protein